MTLGWPLGMCFTDMLPWAFYVSRTWTHGHQVLGGPPGPWGPFSLHQPVASHFTSPSSPAEWGLLEVLRDSKRGSPVSQSVSPSSLSSLLCAHAAGPRKGPLRLSGLDLAGFSSWGPWTEAFRCPSVTVGKCLLLVTFAALWECPEHSLESAFQVETYVLSLFFFF